jgi:AcrR family transcriptional regulator
LPDKSADKKLLILQAALKLFTTQGSRATSMQDIADQCGISKGSLYLHFKSKEDLETEIYNYCYRTLEERLVLAEQEADLSPKDKLRSFIGVMVSYVFELREFLKMQLLEWAGSGKTPLEPEVVQHHNRKLLKLLHTKLIEIYGPDVLPYLGDLLLLIHGMLGSYFRLLFLSARLPFSWEKIPDHLLNLLDYTVDMYTTNKVEPLIPAASLETWMEQEAPGDACGARHPLSVLRELRRELQRHKLETPLLLDTYQTLSILEEEFLQSKPRRAILSGMLANLEPLDRIDTVRTVFRELQQLILVQLEDETPASES